QNNKPLVRPRPIAGAILNEEETYEPLADPEPDLPLTLDILGETQPEQSAQRFDPEVLAEITAAIQQTVSRISKIELVPLGDPIVGMSAILLNFEPKDHFKSLKSLTELTKDLSVATNREKVRIDISTGVKVELSLTNEEREYVPILPLLEEVAEVDVEAAPQYLIGRTQDRAPYQLDVDSALHLLVGGSTGGGKSVLLHSIIWGLIFRYPPSRVRLVLYDRKGEEFAHYRSLPHLWQPIITNEGGFHRMLENVTAELNRRIEVRKADPYASFTWLIVIMDEFRGLTNDAFVEFTSMARSYQIRVILGTQRADKESISTRVKQNLGTNIALKVRDHRESQLIIGNSAAEDLLMWGDCLVHSAKGLERIQVGNVTKDDLMLLREALR
ncbi:MAG: FtsK/SpoIIIE domain-containing protein, partial [Betaproteobacteria bacterium]